MDVGLIYFVFGIAVDEHALYINLINHHLLIGVNLNNHWGFLQDSLINSYMDAEEISPDMNVLLGNK